MNNTILIRRGKEIIRALWIAGLLSLAAAAGAAPSPSLAADDAALHLERIRIPKTAEWEGDWISVTSQITHLDKRGIFTRAAAAGGAPADDIRRAFLKRFASDIARLRIHEGRFTFLSPDGKTIAGEAQYAYAGFTEHMSEGREIQWHRLRLIDGYRKYPALVVSEPHGMLGQWTLIHDDPAAGTKAGRDDWDCTNRQTMMLPADLSAETLAETLDTEEFLDFLRNLPIPPRQEGRDQP